MKMATQSRHRSFSQVAILACLLAPLALAGAPQDELGTPYPPNIQTLKIPALNPIKVPVFASAPKFWLADVNDRSGNPRPLLVTAWDVYDADNRKDVLHGIYLEKRPVAIVQGAFDQALRQSGLEAAEASAADLTLHIYLLRFGITGRSGPDRLVEIELVAVLENPKTGETREIHALGTAVADHSIDEVRFARQLANAFASAVQQALQNFFWGQQLQQAISGLTSAAHAPSGTGSPVTAGGGRR